MKKLLVLILILICLPVAGFAADAGEETEQAVALLREGYVLNGVEGTITKQYRKDIWYFTADEDVSDGKVTVAAGTVMTLMPTAGLEQIVGEYTIEDMPEISVKVWATVSRYAKANYLFAVHFVPLKVTEEETAEDEAVAEEAVEEEAAEEEGSDEDDDDVIPDDIMALLKPKKIADISKMKSALVTKKNVMLVNRSGYLIDKDGQEVFHVDGFGRNVEGLDLYLLPCETLERTEAALAAAHDRLRYRVAGVVTRYKGRNYMLLNRSVRTYSYGNFTR